MLPGDKRARTVAVRNSFKMGGISGRKERGRLMANNVPYFWTYRDGMVWRRYGRPPRGGDFRLYNYCEDLYDDGVLKERVKVRSQKWFRGLYEKEYTLSRGFGWRCNCPDSLKCKHIYMVEEIIRRRDRYTPRTTRSGAVYGLRL